MVFLIAVCVPPIEVIASPITTAVMGDSISAGSGVTGGSPNWVAQLSSTFPGAITFDNEAVGGATSSTVVSGQRQSSRRTGLALPGCNC